ncbi:nitrogen regulatory protein P-II homolog [Hibiscus syriacus]|uniref:nitrogen regulatory protein P-II homolog n=1 Tax=Hibiscus syriacus TaxID=106335 RepID=UPI001923164D|nr:nitrogen regulatory protein P-II homolog [Hibiscus syriacus]
MAAVASSSLISPLHSPSHGKKDYDCPPISTSFVPRFRDSHLSKPKPTLKRSRNASVLPLIRAQNAPVDYTPGAEFYKVEAIIRPWRVQQVSSALLEMGIRGVTVFDVRGIGAQGGSTERHGGSEFSEDKFVAKVKMEIVVSKDQVEFVIDKMIEEARTGEIGDGKIFLIPVADVIRVRTGERGDKAERMTGGRADMSATTLT